MLLVLDEEGLSEYSLEGEGPEDAALWPGPGRVSVLDPAEPSVLLNEKEEFVSGEICFSGRVAGAKVLSVQTGSHDPPREDTASDWVKQLGDR